MSKLSIVAIVCLLAVIIPPVVSMFVGNYVDLTLEQQAIRFMNECMLVPALLSMLVFICGQLIALGLAVVFADGGMASTASINLGGSIYTISQIAVFNFDFVEIVVGTSISLEQVLYYLFDKTLSLFGA